MAGPVTVPMIPIGWRRRPYVRQLVAASCAAAIAGALVGGLGGRLAMRLLAATDSRTTGLMTDDGFEVGRISLVAPPAGGCGDPDRTAGNGRLPVVRSVLMGPPWLRDRDSGTRRRVHRRCAAHRARLLRLPGLRPADAPGVLFVAVPIIHVALFAALAERWLSGGLVVPHRSVRPVALTCVVWVFGAFALGLVAALVVACVAVRLLVHQPPTRSRRRSRLPWIGRAVLVGDLRAGGHGPQPRRRGLVRVQRPAASAVSDGLSCRGLRGRRGRLLRARGGRRGGPARGRLVRGGEYDGGGCACLVGAGPVVAVTHQRSPGTRPGKLNWGIGVVRSLPMLRWCSRNSAVTTAQTVWLPEVLRTVLQQPSR